jgi:hypothetical protein
MGQNPYESPSPIQDRPSATGKVLFRLVAGCCWAFAGILAMSAVEALGRPGMVERRERDPGLFWFAVLIGSGLPILSVILLGWASWRRSGRWALVALIPIGLMVVGIVGVRFYGLYRRG